MQLHVRRKVKGCAPVNGEKEMQRREAETK